MNIVTVSEGVRGSNLSGMKVGQFAKLDSHGLRGTVVRSFEGFVLLDDPAKTWSKEAGLNLYGTILPCNSQITIVTGA